MSAAGRSGPDAVEDVLLEHLLLEAGVPAQAGDPGLRPHPGPRDAPMPLSFLQELLWRLDAVSPGYAYNLPVARRIVGPLDVRVLEASLTSLAARHEVLRTRFVSVDGEPAAIADPPGPVRLRIVDAPDRLPLEHDDATGALLREAVRVPFDLRRQHPFRTTLVRRAENDHVLLLESHHIACDGWSVGILLRDLSALYAGGLAGTNAVPVPPAIQYADFAVWQRAALSGEKLAALLSYWRAELAGRTEPLALPRDVRRGEGEEGAAVRRGFSLPPETTRLLRTLAQRYDATPHMLVLAAYATVLHRYTGRSDVLVGSSVAGRMEPGTEGTVGFFNNTLILRAAFEGDPTFGELLRRVRERCLGAYDHQEIPLEKLVLELHEQGERLRQASLFNVVLTAQEDAVPFELAGTRSEPYGVDLGATKFDLTLFMADSDAGLRLTLRARADLWSPATIERFFGHLLSVFEGVLADPEQRVARLPLLRSGERAQLEAWNGPSQTPSGSVLPLIEAAARRVPARVALRAEDATLTYVEMDRRASRLEVRLRELDATGGLVGILLERSAAAIVAVLGIWKAGAAYVPLPPEIPESRLNAQIRESGCRVVVTVAAFAGRVPPGTVALCVDGEFEGPSFEAPAAFGRSEPPAADSPAYVLFTSGSTGVPKGVVVTHGNLAAYVRGVAPVLGGAAEHACAAGLPALDGRHFSLATTFGADLGHTALFPALCAGGTLHVLSPETVTDGLRFAAYSRAETSDVLKITPSHLGALLAAVPEEERAALLPSRCLVLGGERLSWEFADELLALPGRTCRIVNHYGPTETTVGAATYELTVTANQDALAAGAASVPIGNPLAGVRLDVRDGAGELVPVGVTGELYVAGDGVSRGYLKLPELTAERFVTSPTGERAYRTGDLVRRLGSGELEFLGRGDGQVKVRGYRVELGEIETALAAHPAVAQTAVLLEETDGEAKLVAYVRARVAQAGGPEPGRPEPGSPAAGGPETLLGPVLHEHLRQRLPEHMLPTVAFVGAWPLTPNGKLDRAALRGLTLAAAERPHRLPPRTPVEIELAAMWLEAFRREPGTLGVTDDFFELGGHSLLAIRVLGKVSRRFGVRLTLRAFFEAATIEGLARLVQDGAAGAAALAPATSIRPVARVSVTLDRAAGPV